MVLDTSPTLLPDVTVVYLASLLSCYPISVGEWRVPITFSDRILACFPKYRHSLLSTFLTLADAQDSNDEHKFHKPSLASRSGDTIPSITSVKPFPRLPSREG